MQKLLVFGGILVAMFTMATRMGPTASQDGPTELKKNLTAQSKVLPYRDDADYSTHPKQYLKQAKIPLNS